MMINALNSGARVFMADLEDALSPTWANVVGGQATLLDAVTRARSTSRARRARSTGSTSELATLVVRPRGWHLVERHVLVDGAAGLGEPVRLRAAPLPQRPRGARARRAGPYFYLPKLESHLEARLWNDVFLARAGRRSGIPRGTIRATVLIETILAAFEMEEILYELRDHAAGLNAGRWDYIFSIIKKFRGRPGASCPTARR